MDIYDFRRVLYLQYILLSNIILLGHSFSLPNGGIKLRLSHSIRITDFLLLLSFVERTVWNKDIKGPKYIHIKTVNWTVFCISSIPRIAVCWTQKTVLANCWEKMLKCNRANRIYNGEVCLCIKCSCMQQTEVLWGIM